MTTNDETENTTLAPLVASAWKAAERGKIVRTLPPHDDTEQMPCATIEPARAEFSGHWSWWVQSPRVLTAFPISGVAATFEGAAKAANKALTKLGIEHDGLLPETKTRVAIVASVWRFAVREAFWSRTVPPHDDPHPFQCATIKRAPGSPSHPREWLWWVRHPHANSEDATRGHVDTIAEAAAATNAELTKLGIEHDGLLPGQSIVTE
ncbi:MAG: hypothetical protein ACHREM_00015 [Polyangiales bacterium]